MTKKETLLQVNEELNTTITSLVESIIAVDTDAYINGYKLKNIYDANRELLNNIYNLGTVAFKSYTISKIESINEYALQLISKLEVLLKEVKLYFSNDNIEIVATAEKTKEVVRVSEIVDGEEVIIVDGYKQLNHNYTNEVLEYTKQTCKLPIARYDYLLASKDQKIKAALQAIKDYEKYLMNNRVSYTDLNALNEIYVKSNNLTNSYKMHLRDKERLYKHFIHDTSILISVVTTDNEIVFDELPF